MNWLFAPHLPVDPFTELPELRNFSKETKEKWTVLSEDYKGYFVALLPEEDVGALLLDHVEYDYDWTDPNELEEKTTFNFGGSLAVKYNPFRQLPGRERWVVMEYILEHGKPKPS